LSKPVFKPVWERSRNAEMEREIIELRKQIAGVNSGPVTHQQQPIQVGELTPKQESNQVSPAAYINFLSQALYGTLTELAQRPK
jgi:hypothetical protein